MLDFDESATCESRFAPPGSLPISLGQPASKFTTAPFHLRDGRSVDMQHPVDMTLQESTVAIWALPEAPGF